MSGFLGLTVLLVDDDVDYVDQMSSRLVADGFRVLSAGGQDEAEKLIAQGQAFDVAVLDLMMEHMDSGFVLAWRIKKKWPERGVILVTGVEGETGIEFDASTSEDRQWIKADVLLEKPIRYEQLRRELERLTMGSKPNLEG